jgi:TolB-like protein/Tfp pilus assembly protein PilF
MSASTHRPDRSDSRSCRFGSFEVDLNAGELRKRGLKLRLSGQPFEILRLLLKSPGEVVTREELRDQLWTDRTFVDFDHGLNAAVNKLRETLGDSVGRPRYVETLPRRGYRFIAQVQEGPGGSLQVPTRPTQKRIRSLAVLPLEDLSGDPGQEYFADGMTEALITDLAKISALRVISRTSVMRYKGTQKSLPEIARELNVDGVVEGSVLRIGEHVRISAQLVHSGSDTHLWAESYKRDLSDIFALQAEVAQAIAAAIRVQVTPRERQRLRRARRVDPGAHEAYLLGRFFWNKRTPESLSKSLEHLEQAVKLDPSYALAYAGIADIYIVLGAAPYEMISPNEALPKARAAAQKAVDIDDTLGEAHAALAYITWVYDYDWEAAERGFRRALALSPSYATAHQWHASFCEHQGRISEALTKAERARERDPLSLQVNTALAYVLHYARDYDRAIEQGLRTIELDPAFPTAHFFLALTYMQKGLLVEALAEAEKAATLSSRSIASLSCIGGCYAALGRTGEANKMIEELRALSKEKHVSPYQISWIYAGLQDKESALACLEQAYAERSTYMVLIKMEPAWDFLRSAPRFQDLQRRIGFLS